MKTASFLKIPRENLLMSRGEDSVMSVAAAEQVCTGEGRHCYTQIRNSCYSTSYPSTQTFATKNTTSSTDIRQQWSSKGVLIVIYVSLVLLLAMLPIGSAQECTLRRDDYTIRWRRCIPKRVLSFVCHGTCHSFSATNYGNLTTIVRNCNCCSETAFQVGFIRLRCPKPSGRRGYRTATVRVKVPTGCACRPCDPLPTIQPAEYLS